MKKGTQIPDIPEAQRTPLVDSLLVIIEQLAERVRCQDEEIALLKDEIRILKGEKKRPKFKPSKMDEQTEKDQEGQSEGNDGKREGNKKKRPGSEKRNKTANLIIHETTVVHPVEEIPPGSTFKGYRDFVVQDLVICPHNTRYRLACWETPAGETLSGQLPDSLGGHHFGPDLISYIIYQHHHCQVTQPLLLEQLWEWGIDISSGAINHFLTEDKEDFHAEKDALLKSGLQVSSYVTVDDSGARHKGQNGYVTHIGNEHFAWFESTSSKSRINFLTLLCAGDQGYRLNSEAIAYFRAQKLPQASLNKLLNGPVIYWPDATTWEDHLNALNIRCKRHRRIATEGVLIGNLAHQGIIDELTIVSDAEIPSPVSRKPAENKGSPFGVISLIEYRDKISFPLCQISFVRA